MLCQIRNILKIAEAIINSRQFLRTSGLPRVPLHLCFPGMFLPTTNSPSSLFDAYLP